MLPPVVEAMAVTPVGARWCFHQPGPLVNGVHEKQASGKANARIDEQSGRLA
jgi:hypothetical protein